MTKRITKYSSPTIRIEPEYQKIKISKTIIDHLGLKKGDKITFVYKDGKAYIEKSWEFSGFKIHVLSTRIFYFISKETLINFDDTFHFLKSKNKGFDFDVNLETLEVTFDKEKNN